MSSIRQTEANRRNALNSTGPRTAEGKSKSRRNAVRHGLTAETVIGSLEDAEDYKAFEAAIIADYDAQRAVERELVLRLASFLWRLRRTTAIETGLFAIQSQREHQDRKVRDAETAARQSLYKLFGPSNWSEESTGPMSTITHCFLRLANEANFPLDRLTRYEATLWRQAAQTMFTLHALGRRSRNFPLRRFQNLIGTGER